MWRPFADFHEVRKMIKYNDQWREILRTAPVSIDVWKKKTQQQIKLFLKTGKVDKAPLLILNTTIVTYAIIIVYCVKCPLKIYRENSNTNFAEWLL